MVFAWVLLVGSSVGWPVSAFTFARGEPVTVLALSWIAIWIAALDVLFTAQVHERQNGGSSGGGGMRGNYRDPPGRWAGATNAGFDVYYRLDAEADDVLDTLVIWHWCPVENVWKASNPSKHELVSVQPLRLEPSLMWMCCNGHGWIRNGRWLNA